MSRATAQERRQVESARQAERAAEAKAKAEQETRSAPLNHLAHMSYSQYCRKAYDAQGEPMPPWPGPFT